MPSATNQYAYQVQVGIISPLLQVKLLRLTPLLVDIAP